MNVKPGEPAIIVAAPGPKTMAMVGKIIRVTSPVFDGEWCWEYEGPRVITGPLGAVDLIEDEFLRPIRPDSVTDDEVRDLYAPQLPEVIE